MSNLIHRLRNAVEEWNDAVASPSLRKPTVLQFPINDICNSRCQMCRIWERKRDEEITPDQLAKVLNDPLFSDVHSVGMNGGEPTLRPDLAQLAEVLIAGLPRLSSLSLITNAIRAPKVIAAIESLGMVCRRAGKHLDVMVSLDGVGEVHDRVRGVAGNFESALTVLDHLASSPLVDSHRIGCTIIAENAYGVEEVLDLAKSRGVYARFRLGVPHPRLGSDGLVEPFDLDAGQRFHVAAFLETLIHDYEKDPSRIAFYASLRDQIVYDAPRSTGCAWRNHGATLGPRGELSYCAVASPTLGNAREHSPSALYWDNRPVLANILADRCAGCRHDYEGVANRRVLLRRWAKRAGSVLPSGAYAALRSGWHTFEDWRKFVSSVPAVRCVSSRNHTGRAQRVLLCGWYGTETLGDCAILAGVSSVLRAANPDVQIHVASLYPYFTRETDRLMPELRITEVLSLKEAETRISLAEFAAVIVAGGPMMTPVREVLALKRLLETAKSAGSKTAMLGCGLGPIHGYGARRAAIAWMVREVDECILRDLASHNLAVKGMSRSKPSQVGLDPAFLWLPQNKPTWSNTERKLTIAVALRDWPIGEYGHGLSGQEANEVKLKFERQLLEFVDHIGQRHSHVVIEFVCMHSFALGGDDRWFYRRLLRERPELSARLSWRRLSPMASLERIRNADAVLAMRFHSAVFALGLGKPFLAIDYTRGGKISALLAESGNEDRLQALNAFDGSRTADRLVDEASRRVSPKPVNVEKARDLYQEAAARLLSVSEAQ